MQDRKAVPAAETFFVRKEELEKSHITLGTHHTNGILQKRCGHHIQTRGGATFQALQVLGKERAHAP